MPTSYKEAKDYLVKGRSKVDRPLPGKATRLVLNEDGSIGVRYHETQVVVYHPNGDIVLDSGGWRTLTTKERINTYQHREYIRQQAGVWYVVRKSGIPKTKTITTYEGKKLSYEYHPWEKVCVFEDGMVLKTDGTIENGGDLELAKEREKLGKEANKYTKNFVEALFAGDVLAPSAGDCWYCYLRTDDKQTMGETFGDSDHILSHIREPYYVPSLLLRAIECYPISPVAGSVLHELWYGEYIDAEKYSFVQSWSGLAKRQLRSSLRRYVRQQVGLGS